MSFRNRSKFQRIRDILSWRIIRAPEKALFKATLCDLGCRPDSVKEYEKT